jgi:NAD(P)-dependent dehydrogenase (short-subunit alcohol dehydrogenase family)
VEYVTADVGIEADVRRIAETAVKRFGGFDTWINDAGAATYGKIVDTPVEDKRKVMDTNYWGIVHGSLEAIAHLRDRPARREADQSRQRAVGLRRTEQGPTSPPNTR